MAKIKKEKAEEEIQESQPNENIIEETIKSEKLETFPEEIHSDVMNEEGIVHPISIPDIPAQMEEPITTKAEIDLPSDKPETDEILFLRRILQIQEEGCFGRHLNQLIYDRIKELK